MGREGGQSTGERGGVGCARTVRGDNQCREMVGYGGMGGGGVHCVDGWRTAKSVVSAGHDGGARTGHWRGAGTRARAEKGVKTGTGTGTRAWLNGERGGLLGFIYICTLRSADITRSGFAFTDTRNVGAVRRRTGRSRDSAGIGRDGLDGCSTLSIGVKVT